jgi:hypothetical protein
MKKLLAGGLQHPNAKPLLCNGSFQLQVLCYLGKFKKPASCTTAATVSGRDLLLDLLLGWIAAGRHL